MIISSRMSNVATNSQKSHHVANWHIPRLCPSWLLLVLLLLGEAHTPAV
jgi:hypothetical protein